MQNIGHVSKFPLMEAIYNAIASAKKAKAKATTTFTHNGRTLEVRYHSGKHIYYVVDQKLGYWEQNPAKNNKYAIMARQGSLIIWVIKDGAGDDNFVGRLQDGYAYKKAAAQKVQAA